MSNNTPKPTVVEWRCFHCGEVFADKECAREHFGSDESRLPGCLLKVTSGESGLLGRVRELEAQLIPYLHETSAVENYVHHIQSEHAIALRREEEKGYNRGLRDGMALRKKLLQELKCFVRWFDNDKSSHEVLVEIVERAEAVIAEAE